MIAATTSLLAARGPTASGMQDIVGTAKAPRGSIYHHFPGGKDELIIAAIDQTAAHVEAAVLAIAEEATSPADAVLRIAKLFRAGPERSGWRAGCPVAATAVEGHVQADPVRSAVASAFSRWSRACAVVLERSGMKADQASSFALAMIATLEGALLVSRGMQSADPYDAAVNSLVANANGTPRRAIDV